MNRLLYTLLTLFIAVSAMAVPARKGQWMTLKTADGKQVRAELVGDELFHFWRTASGETYTKGGDGLYVQTDIHVIADAVAERVEAVSAHRKARFEKNFGKQGVVTRGLGNFNGLQGEKKGIVLLVEFADKAFTEEHTPEYYTRVLNENGPWEKGYRGGVKQYFSDQSCGQFTIDFDVYGPIVLPQPYAYYGRDNSGEGSDVYFYEMMRSAVRLANEQFEIDWTQYDWDNDNYVDQTFVLYAGYGQASRLDDPDLIWPKEAELPSSVQVGTKRVKTVACSNELIDWQDGGGDRDSGIGTFCHEFAHCLGFPDLYDIDYACNTTGMDMWDLLDTGSYNNLGFIPAPLTSYQKIQAGWKQAVELEANQAYANMRPVTEPDGGDVYIMHNPANSNECYVFENIKSSGWCRGLYGSAGLLVTHIDFNYNAWAQDLVNCIKNKYVTSRPRYTYIPADGSYTLLSASDLRGDLYPYNGNTTFQGTWYKGGTNCNIILQNIVLDPDGTVSFFTGDPVEVNIDAAQQETPATVPMYNLQGQRIDGQHYRGIVIKNGKKVMMGM